MKTTKTGLQILNREELSQKFAQNTINRKGLLILGLPGVGKTYCVRQPRMVSASQLSMEFQANGLEAVKALINNQINYQGQNVTIDDIGIEDDVKHYGNGLDPIVYTIQRIYDINQTAERSICLYMTSNFNIEELTKKYGERFIDRIYEMCDIVVLEDTNLRRK